jgi:exportin-7
MNSPQRGNSNGGNSQQQELTRIEGLCDQLYSGQNSQQVEFAQSQLNLLQSSVSYIPQCQFILDNSQNPYAILVASEALTKLVTNSWNHFKSEQRVVIRDYLLTFLGEKGPQLAQSADFVVTSIIKLLCRVTRLGWFDGDKHQELTNKCKKFLQATVPHCIIGLQILEELTIQMNLKQANETVSVQRKHAVNYRDSSLLATFQISLQMLQQILSGKMTQANPNHVLQIKKRALGLGIRCLSFDFIGMQPDDSIEDNETIQIPSTWRELVVSPETMQLMTSMYLESKPPQSTLAMELLMLWSSCRRSIFVKEESRQLFLSELLNSILLILKTKQGLSNEKNYHAFCRLLGRIKNNFQLTELLQSNQWNEFSKEITNFTVQSFQNWQWSKNSKFTTAENLLRYI